MKTIALTILALSMIPLLLALSVVDQKKVEQKLTAREMFEEIHAGGN